MKKNLYAVGKIPGGFIKREGRPSERAILTSRLIDRPIRPLFPDGFRNEVQVISMVMSIDQNCPSEVAAMFGSSLALAFQIFRLMDQLQVFMLVSLMANSLLIQQLNKRQ